jgi:undecaprenyl-diphosphatase
LKIKNYQKLIFSLSFLAAFALWTLLACNVDVHPIGPLGSSVGFATINGFFHNLTGVNMHLYTITDWLGLVPVAFGFGFAILGLVQWIRRKNIFKVDLSILILGGFYILVLSAYLLFEVYVINRRPVLIQGYLEASYPSSTTMLVMCVMPTANMQLKSRIQNRICRKCLCAGIHLFVALMVICRLVSGVHWLSDIIGGIFLSFSLITLYCAVSTE